MHFLNRDYHATSCLKHLISCANQISGSQNVSSQLAPALYIISMMIQNENDKHMSELTLRRQLIYRLIEMLHVTSMQSFQRQRLTFRKHTQLNLPS